MNKWGCWSKWDELCVNEKTQVMQMMRWTSKTCLIWYQGDVYLLSYLTSIKLIKQCSVERLRSEFESLYQVRYILLDDLRWFSCWVPVVCSSHQVFQTPSEVFWVQYWIHLKFFMFSVLICHRYWERLSRASDAWMRSLQEAYVKYIMNVKGERKLQFVCLLASLCCYPERSVVLVFKLSVWPSCS